MNTKTHAPDGADCDSAIESICRLDWPGLDTDDATAVALAYYYFSVQFREGLRLAQRLRCNDFALDRLIEGECETDNLSPWPGVARVGERMDHDEFMLRVLGLSPVAAEVQEPADAAGRRYLATVRAADPYTRVAAIASYEDGGLERVFRAMLTIPRWDTPLLQGFQHFIVKHIGFDSDPSEGHGSLARHLPPDDRVAQLWHALRQLFVAAAPRLAGAQHTRAA